MIENVSKRFQISRNSKIYTDIFHHMKGLMFSRPKTIVFDLGKERKIDLHNFFVFFPIDILFLDSDMKVVEIKRDFRPFMLFFPKHKARYIIETPAGHIKNTKVGDKIRIKS
ncbi:MAG: DUF192 domain-containing protein [Nanoarchaeota archaeon]|nr:DUF192 domain-containing protein [Nanoarchaeota archaeon]MBU1704210.1 DUF192 domain-containing protein [Nanoarchaeota archaeon]